MKGIYYNKNCKVSLKDGTIISGVISDWFHNEEENYIIIGSSSIENTDIEKIEIIKN